LLQNRGLQKTKNIASVSPTEDIDVASYFVQDTFEEEEEGQKATYRSWDFDMRVNEKQVLNPVEQLCLGMVQVIWTGKNTLGSRQLRFRTELRGSLVPLKAVLRKPFGR